MCILFTGAAAIKSDSVRTNIVLDSKLVEAGLRATGLKTRRELVDFALRELLRHTQQFNFAGASTSAQMSAIQW